MEFLFFHFKLDILLLSEALTLYTEEPALFRLLSAFQSEQLELNNEITLPGNFNISSINVSPPGNTVRYALIKVSNKNKWIGKYQEHIPSKGR